MRRNLQVRTASESPFGFCPPRSFWRQARQLLTFSSILAKSSPRPQPGVEVLSFSSLFLRPYIVSQRGVLHLLLKNIPHQNSWHIGHGRDRALVFAFGPRRKGVGAFASTHLLNRCRNLAAEWNSLRHPIPSFSIHMVLILRGDVVRSRHASTASQHIFLATVNI